MSDSPLRVEQRGGIRWLFLSRPERRNAFDDSLIGALEDQVADIADDPATAVVVIAGDGPSFSAGGDFRHFLQEDDEGRDVTVFLRRLSACFTRIERSPKPWIAALHGHAIAGGLELALCCDVVVAAEGTMIGDGHLLNRLLPGGGSSVRLERAVGRSTARWMHLSGESRTAEELVHTGWLQDVVPRDQLIPTADALARRLTAIDAGAQGNLKELLVDIADLDEDAALDRELDHFARNWTSRDVPAVLRDFLSARARRV